MIKYLGMCMASLGPSKYSVLEVVQFEIVFLNTISDKRFLLRCCCSQAAIEHNLLAPEFITTKCKVGLRKYCKIKGIASDPDMDGLLSEVRTGVEECCDKWLKGEKCYTTRNFSTWHKKT